MSRMGSPYKFCWVPLLLSAAPLAWSQTVPENAWQQCAATTDNAARLACFDAWAQSQQPAKAPPASAWAAPAASAVAAQDTQSAPVPASELTAAAQPGLVVPTNGGCRDARYSEVSRFYELETGTDCGLFSFRGYRPLIASVITANRINEQPVSERGYTTEWQDYQKQELRLQLSARTKIAAGLLTSPTSGKQDSLWVGYTQQSHWQAFNKDLSRPFRNTDHEPEIFYVYPTDARLPFGWRWRYSGVGLVHHSNGQSDPLSRSWNRWYVMTGAELDNRWQVQAKLWHRISEQRVNDDNPSMADYWGRGEIKLVWNVNEQHTLGLTARGSLNKGYGSGRLEWTRTIGEGWNGGKSNLRFYVQLFSGYGESLIDYNFKRTSLSVGLSLLDF